MSRPTRRKFLKTAAAASAVFSTFTIAGTKSSGKVIGANDTIRVGLAGIHGRGQAHLDGLAGLENVQLTYLIDPDTRLFDSSKSKVREKGGNDPQCIQDIRRALDDKNLDAVSIATPNHWHSLMTIWACQAGKDVYVEKPLSHNLFEGRQSVTAARKYNRIVQHGTQTRSIEKTARQIAAIQSGKYGKLLVSKGYCCKPRWSIGTKPTSDPPANLDFNLWLGPAPKQPFHKNLVHYNWHWFWDTGNGDTGNQGVHQMDVARWAIKGATLPKSVWSLGGRFGYEDQGQTPNTQLSLYDFGETLLVFETRGLVGGKSSLKSNVSNEFYTSEGVIKDWTFHPNGGGKPEAVARADAHVTPGGPFAAFIHAMRSRRIEDNNADVEVGHYSSALCHLGNISYRLGEVAELGSGQGNKEVRQALENIRENLEAVGVKAEDTHYRVGRPLKFDVESEKFVGDEEANRLLTRDYRKPFVVPEKV